MATASPAESAFPPKPTPTPPDSEAPLAPGKLPEAEKPTLPEKDCGCDVPVAVMAGQDGPSMSGVHATPTTAELAKAGDLPLLDAEGKSYTFKSIYEDTSVDRHLIIFVRHFFCSVCMALLCSKVRREMTCTTDMSGVSTHDCSRNLPISNLLSHTSNKVDDSWLR